MIAALETDRGARMPAADVVAVLARAKAEAVVGTLVDGEPIDGFILGGDSAFELNGQVYGKPVTANVARERWSGMVGSTGTLHSGHWVIDHRGGRPGRGAGQVASAEVSFASDISEADVDAYIATGEPLAVAGAFTIDGRGQAFISTITGSPSAVIGVSVPALRTLLGSEFGVDWHEFWNR